MSRSLVRFPLLELPCVSSCPSLREFRDSLGSKIEGSIAPTTNPMLKKKPTYKDQIVHSKSSRCKHQLLTPPPPKKKGK